MVFCSLKCISCSSLGIIKKPLASRLGGVLVRANLFFSFSCSLLNEIRLVKFKWPKDEFIIYVNLEYCTGFLEFQTQLLISCPFFWSLSTNSGLDTQSCTCHFYWGTNKLNCGWWGSSHLNILNGRDMLVILQHWLFNKGLKHLNKITLLLFCFGKSDFSICSDAGV